MRVRQKVPILQVQARPCQILALIPIGLQKPYPCYPFVDYRIICASFFDFEQSRLGKDPTIALGLIMQHFFAPNFLTKRKLRI
jgi:hypothetical protein